jgi:hypothetical protein
VAAALAGVVSFLWRLALAWFRRALSRYFVGSFYRSRRFLLLRDATDFDLGLAWLYFVWGLFSRGRLAA